MSAAVQKWTEFGSILARGESPGDPCYEVGESQLADSQTYLLLVI